MWDFVPSEKDLRVLEKLGTKEIPQGVVFLVERESHTVRDAWVARVSFFFRYLDCRKRFKKCVRVSSTAVTL